MTDQHLTCSLCWLPLMIEGDELSVSIGGHCSGCMAEVEAMAGDERAKRQLEEEIAMGWRDSNGRRLPLEKRRT